MKFSVSSSQKNTITGIRIQQKKTAADKHALNLEKLVLFLSQQMMFHLIQCSFECSFNFFDKTGLLLKKIETESDIFLCYHQIQCMLKTQHWNFSKGERTSLMKKKKRAFQNS